MSGLLESTPDGRTSLADTVQPGGKPLTDDLEQADQQVTDLLKQAYATPDSTDLAGDLQDAYDAWESQVWLIANNDKLRAITSTLMTMSQQVTDIETMTGRPKECDRLVQVAHTLPEADDTRDSYLEAHQWILDYNDAYAACTARARGGPTMSDYMHVDDDEPDDETDRPGRRGSGRADPPAGGRRRRQGLQIHVPGLHGRAGNRRALRQGQGRTAETQDQAPRLVRVGRSPFRLSAHAHAHRVRRLAVRRQPPVRPGPAQMLDPAHHGS